MNTSMPLAFVAAAKIKADEAAKNPPKPEALPPVGLGLEPPRPSFQTGAAVREILSGRTGVVVDPPASISSSDLVFMKSDDDGKTYPIPSDQLERIESAPIMPIAAPAAAPAPVPAEAAIVVPEAAEAKPGPKASKLAASALVSDAADKRRLSYASLVAKLPKTLTASALLQEFGYVPAGWDRLVASLGEDGIVVLRSSAKVDVRALLKKDMNPREIIAAACAACGPVRAETLRRIDAVNSGRRLAARIKAAIAGNKAKVAAAAPNKPQPPGDPGPDMVWAWDKERMDWYAFPVSASLRARFDKQTAAKKKPGKKPKVDLIEAAAQKEYDKLLADDHKLFNEAHKRFPKANDMGSDTDGAIDHLMDAIGADSLSEEVRQRLYEMIFDGLT